MPGRMKKKHVTPQQGYDLYAPYYKKDHDYLDSFDWGPTKKILDTILTPESHILDIGAGDGRIGLRLLKTHPSLVACDISRNMLDLFAARSGRKDNLVQCDAMRLPFKEKSFDIACCFFLIVHIDQLDLFFTEVHKILKPGGHLILNNIPQHNPPILEAGEEKIVIDSSYHSDKEVITIASDSGFFLVSSHEDIQKENKVSTVMLFNK